MRVYSGTIGAAALFWGLETGRLPIGVLLALLAEGGIIIRRRYSFSVTDFIRVSDICSLLFVAAVALILFNDGFGFLRVVTGWLPVIISPLLLAQAYSTGNVVIIGTWLARKKVHRYKPFDIRPFFILLCLFAAACGNTRSPFFLPLAAVILLLLFYANRGRYTVQPLFIVIAVILIVVSLPFAGGIDRAERYLSWRVTRYVYHHMYGEYTDPFLSSINFGDTGKLKESGKIVVRLRPTSPKGVIPERLRMAEYSLYSNGKWLENSAKFERLQFFDTESWLLAGKRGSGDAGSVILEYELPRKKGAIPVPYGGTRLWSTTIYELEQNRAGSLHVREGADVVTYRIRYEKKLVQAGAPPEQHLLQLPPEEKYFLDALAPTLDAEDTVAKIEKVREYFADGFSYSLQLVGKGEYSTPLGNFVMHEKSGFCEYYATATALLLRRLGVPARYVVGYLVTERGFWKDTAVVRDRHAHAWVEAYYNGGWQVVDTTPSQWVQMDAEKASVFEPVRDFFSFLLHKIRVYRIGGGVDYTIPFSILVVCLTAFLAIRIYRRMRMEKAEGAAGGEVYRTFPRVNSSLTPVIDFLQECAALAPMGDACLYADAAARACAWPCFDCREFAELYRLHLKKRFDPLGLTAREEALLETAGGKYADAVQGMKSVAR